MPLSGAGPALVLAVCSILAAVLLGIAHHKPHRVETDEAVQSAPTDDVATNEVAEPEVTETLVEAAPAMQPVVAAAAPVIAVPPQPPAPPVEQRMPLVRDILPGR